MSLFAFLGRLRPSPPPCQHVFGDWSLFGRNLHSGVLTRVCVKCTHREIWRQVHGSTHPTRPSAVM